jgi:hypothetical protein
MVRFGLQPAEEQAGKSNQLLLDTIQVLKP